MNLSLKVLLIRNSQFSPILSPATVTDSINIEIQMCEINKQVFSLIYGRSNVGFVSKKSIYNRFLSSAIYFDREFYQLPSNIGVFQCIFKHCRAYEGAAIKYTSAGNNIVEKSIFFDCRAEKSGGAVFSNPSSFVSNQCCFYFCSQGTQIASYGGAIYVISVGFMNITQNLAFYCPMQLEKPWHNIYHISEGKSCSSNINTSNSGANYDAGIEFSILSWCSARYIVNSNNIAGCGVSVATMSDINSQEYQYFVFMNNTVSKGLFYLLNIRARFDFCTITKINGPIGFNDAGFSDLRIKNSIFDKVPNWGTGITEYSGSVFTYNGEKLFSETFIDQSMCFSALFGANHNNKNTCQLRYGAYHILPVFLIFLSFVN